MSAERLSEFVTAVRRQTLGLLDDDRFPDDQKDLLKKAAERLFAHADPGDWAQPLGLLYAAYRSCGRPTDRQAHLVGAFCVCYLTSFDLFDDVQDNDLAGKPLEAAGTPIAINTALALFLVALRALHDATVIEADPALRIRYLDVLNRASLVAVGAQHLDLTGLGTSPSPEAVLAMNRGKTSSIALLAECGALLGGADPNQAATFRDFGNDFAALVQIVDDVRDVFGKDESPDLVAGKITYPIACFLSAASPTEKDEYSRLRADLPASQEAIRELLHASGAVDASARAVEDLRLALHRRVATFASLRAEHRLLLTMVDALSSTLYEPEPVPESALLFAPTGGFHDELRGSAQRFLDELELDGILPLPTLTPWLAPLYLFEPEAYAISYPDLAELRAETGGRFADALGLDAQLVDGALHTGMPLQLAHELVHAWRHTSGRLSDDAWHEEFVANRLAMGYALRFEPEAAQATLAVSRLILAHVPPSEGEEALLARARQQGNAADYDLSFQGAARVHARMLLEAAQTCHFDADREHWLSAPPVDAGRRVTSCLVARAADSEPIAAE